MKINTIVFLTLLFGQIKGQVALSKFSPVNFTIKVPTEIRGVSNDSLIMKSDFYEYNFKGVLYKNNEGLLPLKANGYKGNSNQDDPVKVIADFYFAYQSGNVDLLKKLINPEFKQKMEESNSLIDFEKKSAGIQSIDSIRILCAFEIDGGYWVMSESRLLGIQNDFLVKKDGKYFITPSNNLMSTPRINNLMIYFTFKPLPYKKPLVKASSDTLKGDVKSSFIVQLKNAGDFIIFYFPKKGEQVFVNMKDNTNPDMDKNAGIVNFKLTPNFFMKNGENVFYAIETNYPVSRVTDKMIEQGIPVKVFIK